MTEPLVSGRAPRVLVVYKKSTYQLYVREQKHRRMRRLIREGDPVVEHVMAAHEDHEAAVAQARAVLKKLGVRATFQHRRDPAPEAPVDLVVTLGGDGTLLWASHRVGADVPMLAINTSPGNSVGYFCAGGKDAIESILSHALAGTLRRTELARMQVSIDGETITSRVLNDVLFCHRCPAATTRYLLKHGRVEEDQRSSGLWVGPPAGSTAAQRSAGGKVLPLRSQRIQYVVREPYTLPGSRYQLERGVLEPGEALRVRTKMAEGRIFVDGPYQEFEVDIGSEIAMSLSPEPLTLLGLHR